MKTSGKIIIVAALAVAVAGAVALRKGNTPIESNASASGGGSETKAAPGTTAKLPKLLDLGADKCIPCKMMAPILEGLKKEYAGRMDVEFIDVWKNPAAGERYGIEMIPTRIFYDASGKELFRHTGFFGKEDILGKWKELGVDLSGGKTTAGLVRETPVAADTHPREAVCFMCDGDLNAKTKTVVKGQSEQRVLCGLSPEQIAKACKLGECK